MKVKELRELYLKFFEEKGHTIISSASLIPDNDPTVLFTTAGMHPLVPYLLGEKHPAGKRLTDAQKCVRTGDIDEVGDCTHCTFFEMLGNWSLGDYFKKESISYSYEFLTRILKLPSDRIAVSVFVGDEEVARDDESAGIWEGLGIKKENIFFLPKKNNWWGAGATGPCGPDTEIFYITDKEKCCEECSPACDCGRYVEIWNNVFMSYDRGADGVLRELSQKNVDTGMGAERTVAMLNGYSSVYETDVFAPIMALIKEKTPHKDRIKEQRIIADHMRTTVFMLGDEKGVLPSNVDQGYILRRIIRRALRFSRLLELDKEILSDICRQYIDIYKDAYPELLKNSEHIVTELEKELERFGTALNNGLKEFEKLLGYIKDNKMSGKAAFRLFDTFGFPIEMTLELAKDHGVSVDVEGFERAFAEHRQKSQTGAEQKFKGGLADSSEATTRLHTATHLLLAGLKAVLKDDTIMQKGSNITPERLRFDFNFPRPLSENEIAEVEAFVNTAIKAAVEVNCEEMSIESARNSGATGSFGDRYSVQVKVYTIPGFSKEICGGPHASNTKELGVFKIVKEQSSSAGVRRIKGILEGQ